MSLNQLFSNRLFRVPDYQRGYAWQDAQVNDFWDDLMRLDLKSERSHYTGLLSLKRMSREEIKEYLGVDEWLLKKEFNPYCIVDGQQRITTSILLINEIINRAKELKPEDQDPLLEEYRLSEIRDKYICKQRHTDSTIVTYLFGYVPGSPSMKYLRHEIFGDQYSGPIEESYYTKNLLKAKENLQRKVHELSSDGLDSLFIKLTQRLKFNFYEINDDYDVFVAFETMNNRGRPLTNLEKLKNRLIYLATLNASDESKDNQKLEETNLRENINAAWTEIYRQLGRNPANLLDDDAFLKDHWILNFSYKKDRGDAAMEFLMEKFSTTNEELKAQDILNYVSSLKDTAQYWYDSHYPAESTNLTQEEKDWLDRLLRMKIAYFRPLVTALISRRNIQSPDRVKAFKAIERFLFVRFCIGSARRDSGESKYYKAAAEIFNGEITVDKLIKQLENDITDHDGIKYAIESFIMETKKRFDKDVDKEKIGYYAWEDLKYFLYEYELYLRGEYHVTREFPTWKVFTASERDKVSIEHILPQTLRDSYWKERFGEFSEEELKKLTGALGNLLPLSQRINASLQEKSFPEKKEPTRGKFRGYANGCHSEVEVAQLSDWTAEAIYERSKKLLEFMSKRWDIHISDDQMEALIGLDFLKPKKK